MAISGLSYESGSYATQGDLLTAGGLVLITTQSFSAASTVSVDGCFTSTYDNFRVLVAVTSGSASNQNIYMRLRLSGTDANTNYSWGSYSVLWSSGVGTAGANATVAQWQIGFIDTAGEPGSSVVDLFAPGIARHTHMTGSNVGNLRNDTMGGKHATATAYDGFSIVPASGTITGTLSIYGYKK